jgi:hypothetical protein
LQEKDKREGAEESDARFTKDEMNFAELPLALPCHRAPKDKKAIRVTFTARDPQNRPIEREWLVTGDSLYGLPLATDEEVFLGLMHFLHRSGFQDRRVHFTQYSLFQRLGWGDSRRAYDRLQTSLDRLKGATIRSKEAFWDHKGKCFVTRAFNVIDDYTLCRRAGPSDGDEPFISSVSFSEFMFESFRAGFIKTLDLDMYLELSSPIARKLFRLLDKKLYKGPVYDVDLLYLAQRVALTDAAFPSQVKQKFEGAHEELVKIGFLKSVRYLRKGGSTLVRYTMAAKSEWKPVRERVRVLPEEHPLIHELTTRGVTRDVAQELLKQHGEKTIADKLEVFDHLMSDRSPTVTKNPAGFLRSSIEKDFAPPTGYVSREERLRRKDEEAQARRRALEHEQQLAVAEAERQAQFDALWSSLTAEERQTIEAQVLQGLNDFARKAYRREQTSGKIGAGHHALRAAVNDVLASRINSLNIEIKSGNGEA